MESSISLTVPIWFFIVLMRMCALGLTGQRTLPRLAEPLRFSHQSAVAFVALAVGLQIVAPKIQAGSLCYTGAAAK